MKIGQKVRLLKDYKQFKIGDIGKVSKLLNEESAYISLQLKDFPDNFYFMYISTDMIDIFWEFVD